MGTWLQILKKYANACFTTSAFILFKRRIFLRRVQFAEKKVSGAMVI